MNQRSFARLVHVHVAGDEPLDRTQLDSFTRMLVSVEIDLKLTPATYYLYPSSEAESVADAARLLHVAATRSLASDEEPTRRAARRLLRAIDQLAAQVAKAHLPRGRDLDTAARLQAWCEDGRSGLRA